jgi:hypothetical protein
MNSSTTVEMGLGYGRSGQEMGAGQNRGGGSSEMRTRLPPSEEGVQI